MAFSTASKKHVESATAPPTASHPLEAPKYYDSEHSTPSPQYPQTSGKNTTRPSYSDSGALAANIAATLAYPLASELCEQKETDKRPWRERWRGLDAWHNDIELGGNMQVQGIVLESWTSINKQHSRNRR